MRRVAIINSVHRRQVQKDLLSSLRTNHGFEIAFTDFPNHARYLAQQAAERGAETVLVVGGDGTLNQVLNGLFGSETTLAIWPHGTANDFAAHCGIDRLGLDSRGLFFHHTTESIDVIRVNGWHYATIGGIGLPCEVLKKRQYMCEAGGITSWLSRKSGAFAYLHALSLVSISAMRAHGVVTVETGAETFTCNPVSLLIANQPVVGHTFRIAPKAINTDGLCDLHIINDSYHLSTTLRAVGATIWSPLGEPHTVVRLQAERFRVITEEETNFFGDGEMGLKARVFDVSVVPHAIKVLVPARAVADKGYTMRRPFGHRRLRGLVSPIPASVYDSKR